jgi:lysophospholipase L1-like esterase
MHSRNNPNSSSVKLTHRELSWKRKLGLSLLTVALTAGVIEGLAQFIWWRLESQVMQRQKLAGEQILRNDALNFMKIAHRVYGYTTKPGFRGSGIFINNEGFHQTDTIPIQRRAGRLRVVCLGESTTFGTNVQSNYPVFLRTILKSHAVGYEDYEVINAGVPGWVSDQIALRVRHQLAEYKPDAVILYMGWNDFQSYSPLDPPPTVSYFEQAYSRTTWKQFATMWFKSIALLSAWYHSGAEAAEPSSANTTVTSPEKCYRFLFRSMDQILDDFRRSNPSVKVFVCTLVGRWPLGTQEEWGKIPQVWWMTRHGVTPQEAVPLVAALNEQLRRFAQSRGAPLIDLATSFDKLDRARLQWDWAHMYPDGYELMAWSMFSALHQAGVVRVADESPRPAALISQYRMGQLVNQP